MEPCHWAQMFAIWPFYNLRLLCHPYQELVAAVGCLLAGARGPRCWTSTLALHTAPCPPTIPSSSRSLAGAPLIRQRTLTVDLGPSQCISLANLQARAPVGPGPLENHLQTSQECFPMEPTCPAVWTALLHLGIRVSILTANPFCDTISQ